VKKVGYLSGGQRARLSLAAATWWSPNCLLLDEPTNHLDVDSLDALSIGLQAYEGAVIVVSHNQGFLNTLCEELWIVEGGTVKVCPKGDEAFSDFFKKYVKKVEASLK
jgi:ATP-binding cassette subfamily F protein 3